MGIVKESKCMPDINTLVKMCRSAPGCVGYEWIGTREIRAAYKPDEKCGDMFDVWFDSGAEVVEESALKSNEAEYPYTRYLIRWPAEPPTDLRQREGIYKKCKQPKRHIKDSYGRSLS